MGRTDKPGELYLMMEELGGERDGLDVCLQSKFTNRAYYLCKEKTNIILFVYEHTGRGRKK